jgi:hypothetical protein
MGNERNRQQDFEWRCVVGSIDTDPRDYVRESLFGLPLSQTFIYGTVRDADGNIWTPMRRLSGDADAYGENFLLQSNAGNDALRVHKAGRSSARGHGAIRSLEEGALHLTSNPSATGDPFELRADARVFHWSEGDTLELEGAAVPPGLHWHLPDRDKGMYYMSQIYQVEGRILDRDVRGFIPLDQLWMHGLIYIDDIFIGDEAEVVWYTWATRYVDGSFEGGHFMVGHRRLGFAVVYDEMGQVSATTDVDASVTLDGDGPWPSRIDLTAAGETWEFLPDARGRMVDLMPIPNPQIEGRWRRSGDTREPLCWFAWGEIAPSHGLARRRHLGVPETVTRS